MNHGRDSPIQADQWTNLATWGVMMAFFAVIAVIGVYGIHRYWLVWLYLRRRNDPARKPPAGRFESLPKVTIQLPMYNELHVAKRVIEAACRVAYPGELLQIQVLDDSTDESAEVVRRVCEEMRSAGHDVQLVQRMDRAGFKAGALAEGMKTATGEFIAVFDADFIPPRDFLHRMIHTFAADPSIGMVQAAWAHLNTDASLLTRCEALFLDGHFTIEQTARARNGRWFNFNGTAGIWRRSCIQDAGGWRHDTLTEDADLSYRAQLAGWRFEYRPDVRCPAELPPTVGGFIGQQHRWNKGLIQTGVKLLPQILKSDARPAVKIEAWFHLTSPVVYVVMLWLTLLVWPGLLLTLPFQSAAAGVTMGLGVLTLALGTCAASTFYIASQIDDDGDRLGRMARTAVLLPVLMAIGIGLSVVNTKAVIEGLLGITSPFIRTPKFNAAAAASCDPAIRHRRQLFPAGLPEVVLGLATLAAGVVCVTRPVTLVGTPFLLLFAAGYLAIGIPLLTARFRRQPPLQKTINVA